jgi:hypothetical protein
MSVRDSQVLVLTVFLRLLNKLTDHLFGVLCIMKIWMRETKQSKLSELPWYAVCNTAGYGTEANILLLAKDRRSGFCNMLNSIYLLLDFYCRSERPCGLRRRSAAARLLRLWVRIPPGAWMFLCYECCVLSGRGLCDELITHLKKSYWLRCVGVCDLKTL